jgi:hypothetical protein
VKGCAIVANHRRAFPFETITPPDRRHKTKNQLARGSTFRHITVVT